MVPSVVPSRKASQVRRKWYRLAMASSKRERGAESVPIDEDQQRGNWPLARLIFLNVTFLSFKCCLLEFCTPLQCSLPKAAVFLLVTKVL